MKSNLRLYALLLLSFGILSAILYETLKNSIQVMYPGNATYFLNFFYGLGIIALLPGVFIRLKSSRGKLISIYYLLFFVLSIACIYTGSAYSYNLKTDEFLLYFLSVCTSALIYVAGISLLLKFFLLNPDLKAGDKWKLAGYGFAGILAGSLWNLLVQATAGLAVIHSWYLGAFLILFMYFASRREKRVMPVE